MKLEVAGSQAYCYTNYRDIDPSNQSVIFIHGAGMDHTVWVAAARHFARHGRNVIALDLPGHGRSEGEALQTVEAMADWTVQLLDALGLAQAAVVGHSLGSLVALDVAARHADRCRALAMVGTTVPMPVSDAILQTSAANDPVAFDMLTQWGYSKRHQYGGSPDPGVWMTGSTLRLFEKTRPGVLHADMHACNAYRDGLERAAAVRCPSMLVLGEGDRLTPVRSTRALQQSLADAELALVPGAGHTLMVEAPNALLDALRRIL